MKCMICNEEWELKNAKNLKEKYCPFCGKEIVQIDRESVIDVVSFFRYVLYHEGKIFFRNSQKVLGLFSDFLPKLVVEKRILRIALESSVYEKIDNQSNSLTNNDITKYIRLLEQDFGLSSKWAKVSIEWYLKAINVQLENQPNNNKNRITKDEFTKKDNSIIKGVNQYEKYVRIPFSVSMLQYSEIRNSSKNGNWAMTKDDTLIVGRKGRSHATDKSEWSRAKILILTTGIQFTETRAFYGLKNLEIVCLPSSLLTIGFQSFGECDHLRIVLIEEGNLETISGRAFENCKSLTDFKIPSSIKSIGDSAFVDCKSLKTTVPSKCNVYNGNSAIEKLN